MNFVNTKRILAGLTTTGILAISGTSYAAGTAAFSLTGASATNSGNATVSLYENGTSINVVTATFTYDSSKLQFVTDNCAGAFSSPASSSSTSISCFVPGGAAVSGSNEFASVTFKAIATGNATVTVNGSMIVSNSTGVGVDNWNGSPASATVSVAAPTTPSTPSQPSGGSSTSSKGKNTGSKPVTNGSSNPTTNQNKTTSSSSTNGSNSNSNGSKGKGTGTSTSNKSDNNKNKGNGKAANLTNGKSHRASYVTSSISIVLILAAAAYWFFFMKRTETATAKVYKLDTNTKKSKTAAPTNKKQITAKSTRAQTKKSKTS